jgi:carboxyl-terminal processing protease
VAYELSDGAVLVLTVATMADRTGRRYGTSIEPDVQASPRTGADVAAATTWLASQPGCS